MVDGFHQVGCILTKAVVVEELSRGLVKLVATFSRSNDPQRNLHLSLWSVLRTMVFSNNFGRKHVETQVPRTSNVLLVRRIAQAGPINSCGDFSHVEASIAKGGFKLKSRRLFEAAWPRWWSTYGRKAMGSCHVLLPMACATRLYVGTRVVSFAQAAPDVTVIAAPAAPCRMPNACRRYTRGCINLT